MKIKLIIAVAIFGSFSAFAQGNFDVKFNYNFLGNPFDKNSSYTDKDENTIDIQRGQFYLTMEKLICENGTKTINIDSSYILADMTDGDWNYIVSNTLDSLVDATQIEFSFGIDSSVNHLDPTLWPMSHPLAPKSPDMHWGWLAGYKFLVLEGYINGSIFQIHATGDEFYEQIVLTDSIVENGGNVTAYISMDIGQWLNIDNVTDIKIEHGKNTIIESVMENTSAVFGNTPSTNTSLANSPIDKELVYVQSYGGDFKLYYEFPTFSEFTPNNIQIVDMTGKIVVSNKIADLQGYVNLNHLKSGIYFYRLNSNENVVQSSRFVKH